MKQMKAAKGTTVLKFKVTQSDWQAHVRGYPYRVIEILANQSLNDLALAILDSFSFVNDHMYGFYDNLRSWPGAKERYELFKDDPDMAADPWLDTSAKSVKQTAVETAFDVNKKKLLFLFDYGDEWRFIVQRMGESTPELGAKYPRLVLSYGDALSQYPWFDEEDDEVEDDGEA